METMRDHSVVRNPLTVIAIFARIAEVSGTIVLPLLGEQQQSVFMIFVMGFPCLLVMLFFGTLIFRHEVLYAPSDFREDASFLGARRRQQDRAALDEKFREDLAFVVAEPELPSQPPAAPPVQLPEPTPEATRIAHGTYLLAEKLVLDKLEKEMPGIFGRNTVLRDGDAAFAFDATVRKDGSITAIDVKYFPTARVNRSLLRNLLTRWDDFYNHLSPGARAKFAMLLAIATDASDTEHAEVLNAARLLSSEFSVPVDIRIYGMKQLEAEVGGR